MAAGFTRLFKTEYRNLRAFTAGDVVALLSIVLLIYFGVRLAIGAPEVIRGPDISIAPGELPWYALLSVSRMTIAYLLSIAFSLVYGRLAAYNRRAEQLLMPMLDVLQSVPILSFLPVVLLSLSALLPLNLAAELASVVLIFTSQAWNLTFAWYQSLTTIPKELREASAIFRLNTWMRFKGLELPFAGISLTWNSMVSWAGGWFFLMAAETFTVGKRDFRLPGLGSYLKEAADQNNFQAILWGLAALVLVIVALDQLVWRPLLAWSDRFRVEMVESDTPPGSWFYDAIHSSRLVGWFLESLVSPFFDRLDLWLLEHFRAADRPQSQKSDRSWPGILLAVGLALGLLYGAYRVSGMLLSLSARDWSSIGTGVIYTTLRVSAALLIALAWTIPVGVAIGTNRRLAALLQPLVQVTASIPATALFPVFLLLILGRSGSLNTAAVLLMLLGTQWYLLFNVIAGANSIPQDLKYTATLMHLSRWERWKTLILPALFPYLVTGAITASGGAWNASIVAEYIHFGGQARYTAGIGALIAQATAAGDYPLLLAGTVSMVLAVILINRLIWQRLYRVAGENYRME